jgi:GAF domain-containing protein
MRKNTYRYTLLGALFGVVFPLVASFIDVISHNLPLTLENLLLVQQNNPLHWIIDTAPIFLGLLASFAGVRQDRLLMLYEELENRITDRDLAVSKLTELQSDLERLVQERTSELEMKASQLRTAADVGRVAANIRDLDTLLTRVSHLISERFNFYHTGIFLLDRKGDYAILRASNSDGGQCMLDRGHRLKVGEEGIVGYVTGTKKPRIALDVGEDAEFFDNPDLPETHSEIALPLVVGERIIGALDVQSRESGAFTAEDIEILQVLADLVAIAIDNANLFTENQSVIDSTQRAYEQMDRAAWQRYLQSKSNLAFVATPFGDVRSIDGQMSSEMAKATQNKEIIKSDDNTVVIPIILRNEVLGVIRLRKPEDDGVWSEDEISLMDSLVDQLELTLESARLYSETQSRAERERMVSEITSKIRSSTDPQTMLQTAVSELKNALQAQRAQVIFQPEHDERVNNLSDG